MSQSWPQSVHGVSIRIVSLVLLLMPNGQIHPRTTYAANSATKPEERHVVFGSALGTLDSHVADLPIRLLGINL